MFAHPLRTRWQSQRRRTAAGLALALLVTVVAACSSGATSAQKAATPTSTPLPTATATATQAAAPAGVYFAADGSSAATVYALDVATGHVRWARHLTTSPGGIQIASTGDLIFVVDFFGTITAVRMEDGTVLWSRSGHRGVDNQPAADSGILFVSSSGDASSHGYLDAYRAMDGALLWEHDAGVNSHVDLGAAANGVLYTNNSQEVDALRGTDGTTLWRENTPPGPVPPILAGNAIYLNNFGEVYALNAASGALLWHYKPPLLASPSDLTAGAGEGLVFAGNSLRLNALHAADGTLAWHDDYHGLVWGPSYANGVVYVSSITGSMSLLYALNPSTGSQIWSVPLHGNTSWPAVLNGDMLYLSRSDGETAQPAGYLYALSPSNGAELWEYTQSGVGFTNAIVV
jgi:outer membrane protein assembly factor BamB